MVGHHMNVPTWFVYGHDGVDLVLGLVQVELGPRDMPRLGE